MSMKSLFGSMPMKTAYFTFGAFLLYGALLVGERLDVENETAYVFRTFFPAVFIVFALLLMNISDGRLRFVPQIRLKYMLVIIIEAVINLFVYRTPIDKYIPFTESASAVALILVTVICEEVYFRMIGTDLFSDTDGRLTVMSFLIIVSVYTLAYITFDIIKYGFSVLTVIKLITAFSVGFFRLVLYMRTGNLYLSIFANVIFSFASEMYTIFSTSRQLPGKSVYILMFLNVVVFSVSGIYMTKDLYNIKKK